MAGFWQPKDPQHWAHGFLICKEVQSTGLELHASFPRDGDLPHLSVYELKVGSDDKKETQCNLVESNGSMGLNGDDYMYLLFICKFDQKIIESFLKEVYDKHRALNYPSKAASSTPEVKNVLSADEFPALAAQSTRSTPPLISSQPVANTPAQNAFKQKKKKKNWVPLNFGQ